MPGPKDGEYQKIGGKWNVFMGGVWMPLDSFGADGAAKIAVLELEEEEKYRALTHGLPRPGPVAQGFPKPSDWPDGVPWNPKPMKQGKERVEVSPGKWEYPLELDYDFLTWAYSTFGNPVKEPKAQTRHFGLESDARAYANLYTMETGRPHGVFTDETQPATPYYVKELTESQAKAMAGPGPGAELFAKESEALEAKRLKEASGKLFFEVAYDAGNKEKPYYLRQVAAPVEPLARPEYTTDAEGNRWVRTSAGGAWQKAPEEEPTGIPVGGWPGRAAPAEKAAPTSVDQMIVEALVNGDNDRALSLDAFQKQPTAFQLAQFAQSLATDPQDFLKIFQALQDAQAKYMAALTGKGFAGSVSPDQAARLVEWRGTGQLPATAPQPPGFAATPPGYVTPWTPPAIGTSFSWTVAEMQALGIDPDLYYSDPGYRNSADVSLEARRKEGRVAAPAGESFAATVPSPTGGLQGIEGLGVDQDRYVNDPEYRAMIDAALGKAQAAGQTQAVSPATSFKYYLPMTQGGLKPGQPGYEEQQATKFANTTGAFGWKYVPPSPTGGGGFVNDVSQMTSPQLQTAFGPLGDDELMGLSDAEREAAGVSPAEWEKRLEPRKKRQRALLAQQQAQQGFASTVAGLMKPKPVLGPRKATVLWQ